MKSTLIVVFLTIIILFLGGIAYMMYKGNTNQAVLSLPTPTSEPTTTVVINDQNNNMAVSPSVSEAPKKPIIIFEAEGAIPEIDKLQLTARVVNPITDYYFDTNGAGYVVTITISPNNQTNKSSYPYLGKIVFNSGGYAGFVIEKKADGIAWWFPECMAGCNFSDSFKAKYPEIIKISNP